MKPIIKRRLSTFSYGLGLLALGGCQAANEHPSEAGPVSAQQSIIYGNDDRAEAYAYADQNWASQAQQFSVALMLRSNLDKSNSNDIRVTAATVSETFGLCASERFSDQPAGAYCSGTLIAPDLVLTAGHCAQAHPCADTDLVFNYRMNGATTLAPLTTNDVYACAQEVVTVYDRGIDYSILRLDRPAVGRTPAAVRRGYAPIDLGTPLRINGHPLGIPLKIADSAGVRNPRANKLDFFENDLDIYPGNSGSGVFSLTTGELAGVAVRSVDRNWAYVKQGDCDVSRVIPTDFFAQGQTTYVARAIDGLCRAMPGHSLCHCGDGRCESSLSETTATCAADCSSSCGDGTCNGNETAVSCYADCGQCGNGVCEASEAQAGNCCMDCGASTPFECPSQGQAKRPRIGDVDADGVVTNADALLIAQHYTGGNLPINTASADVDCDGDIDVVDALAVDQYAQGSRQRFACEEVVRMTGGDSHTCVVERSGDARCWGLNNGGQLGYGHTDALGDQPNETPSRLGNVAVGGKVARIDAGPIHNCAVLDTGAVRCWGSATSGLGYMLDQYPFGNIGDDEAPARYGDLLLGAAAQQTALGIMHSCVLLSSGAVRCWGGAMLGQNGNGLGLDIGLTMPPGAAGDLNLGGRAIQVAAKTYHSCALLETGAVRCWGYGGDGRLGYGNKQVIGDDETPAAAGDVSLGGAATQVATGYSHSCALLSTGDVRCWGDNSKGQLGYGHSLDIGDDELPSSQAVVSLGGKATQVVAGAEFSCALLQDGSVRCWGDNTYGQLGLANTDNIGDDELPSSVSAINLGGATRQLMAGGTHVCALMTSGDLRCWGNNLYGQLGYGNTSNIGDNETPASVDSIRLWTQAASSCTDATAIDLRAQQTATTVPSNACLKITQYPGNWVKTVVLQTQAGGSGYPIPFTWTNCSTKGRDSLTGDWQMRNLAGASSSCTTRIRLQGPDTGSVTLKWWGNG